MAALWEMLGGVAIRRERVFRDRSNPLDLYDDVDMFKKYRFNRAGVIFLITKLQNNREYATKRNKALPASLQLFVALRFFATGSVLDSAATFHGCSNATVSRVVRRVVVVNEISAPLDQMRVF